MHTRGSGHNVYVSRKDRNRKLSAVLTQRVADDEVRLRPTIAQHPPPPRNGNIPVPPPRKFLTQIAADRYMRGGAKNSVVELSPRGEKQDDENSMVSMDSRIPKKYYVRNESTLLIGERGANNYWNDVLYPTESPSTRAEVLWLIGVYQRMAKEFPPHNPTAGGNDMTWIDYDFSKYEPEAKCLDIILSEIVRHDFVSCQVRVLRLVGVAVSVALIKWPNLNYRNVVVCWSKSEFGCVC